MCMSQRVFVKTTGELGHGIFHLARWSTRESAYLRHRQWSLSARAHRPKPVCHLLRTRSMQLPRIALPNRVAYQCNRFSSAGNQDDAAPSVR